MADRITMLESCYGEWNDILPSKISQKKKKFKANIKKRKIIQNKTE
jgi:hypothetical protein